MSAATVCMDAPLFAGRPRLLCVKGNAKIHLVIWIAAILLFMFVIGPLLARTAVMQPIYAVIEARGIEANMYFYTEVDAFDEAQVIMNNTRTFAPRNPELR